MEFDVGLERTAAGFGIFFTKAPGDVDGADVNLVVDGLVEPAESENELARHRQLQCELRLGDRLIGVNALDCRGLEIAEVLHLLRTAPMGDNVLRFSRSDPVGRDLGDDATSIKRTVLGALMKVTTRLRAEIDGDEDEIAREQLEDARFKEQWLREFDGLKAAYAHKWDTCTYAADEFCGLLFHSSDAQQQEDLLREYPTLMETWRDADVRLRPDWPAARVVCGPGQHYTSTVPMHPSLTSSPALTIEASSSLSQVFSLLRTEFQWPQRAIEALAGHLEREHVLSCDDLCELLEGHHGARFERTFQSRAYPRVTRALCQSLLRRARVLERSLESLVDASMEPLHGPGVGRS